MSKVCEYCHYASGNDTDITCAQCGAYLPTLVPPTARLRGDWQGDGVGSRLLASPLGLVVLFVLTMAGIWAVSSWIMRDPGPGTDGDSTHRIRVGMHVSEVGRFLNEKLPPQKYLELHYNFPADESGDGRIDYEGDGVKMRIHFIGGEVTSVEESPSSLGAGNHRCSMIIQQR
jgi:hypothetical protein